MRRLLTLLCSCCLLFAVAAPNASAKKCPKPSASEVTKVFGGVTCKQAKKVIKAYATGKRTVPFGFVCADTSLPKGTGTTCTSGSKRIAYYEAA